MTWPSVRGLRILAYHAVETRPRRDPLCRYAVPARDFVSHIDHLARARYAFIGAADLLAALDGERRLPAHAALLTFDDCHVSVERAAEIMERRGIPGIAFAVAQTVNSPVSDVEAVEPLLDLEGLRRVSRHGLEIGAHGMRHCRLTAQDDQQLQLETAGAVVTLRSAAVGPVRLFAYPFGAHSLRVREAVHRSGVAAAFTTEPAIADLTLDRFALPRLEVFNGDRGLRFALKVESGGGLMRVRSALRLRTRVRVLLGRAGSDAVGHPDH